MTEPTPLSPKQLDTLERECRFAIGDGRWSHLAAHDLLSLISEVRRGRTPPVALAGDREVVEPRGCPTPGACSCIAQLAEERAVVIAQVLREALEMAPLTADAIASTIIAALSRARAGSEPMAPDAGTAVADTVPRSVYESAVNGRRAFRNAYREAEAELETLRAKSAHPPAPASDARVLTTEQIKAIIRQHCYPFSDVGVGGIATAAEEISVALAQRGAE